MKRHTSLLTETVGKYIAMHTKFTNITYPTVPNSW